ncbi:MAG: hypothetical protein IJS82_03785 [Paludibacteraceae bacterium]|nr:hypothetical protein [Paludibacteraceae bacterium]
MMVAMTQDDYEEILVGVEVMREEVYAWNDRLLAEKQAQNHLQNLPPWTPENYPYRKVDSEKTISMLIRYFNDCYLKVVCLELRKGALTIQVPNWVTATRDIIEALNDTGRLMREIMYAHKQLRKGMIDIPSLQQDASIDEIKKTIASFRYNLQMQSRIRLI